MGRRRSSSGSVGTACGAPPSRRRRLWAGARRRWSCVSQRRCRRGLRCAGGILRVSQTPAVRVGRGEVDTFYDVRAADPLWAGIALGAEGVGDALRPIRQHVGSVALVGGVLRLVVGHPLSPDDLLPIAHRLVTLAEAIAEASVSAWREGGRARGLGLRIVGGLALRLRGPQERISLRFATSHPDAVGTQVLQVRIGGGFPDDVVLERRRPEDPPGQPLGDLILDRGLRAWDGPADLGTRLGRDDVRGPLLDLLHGPDTPRVAFGGIELRARGGATPRLLDRLDEVDALARALEAGWR
jgi:hypothetical protein